DRRQKTENCTIFQGFERQGVPLGRPGQRTGLLQQALQRGLCHEMNPPRKKNWDKPPTAWRGNTTLGRGCSHRDADGWNGSGGRCRLVGRPTLHRKAIQMEMSEFRRASPIYPWRDSLKSPAFAVTRG